MTRVICIGSLQKPVSRPWNGAQHASCPGCGRRYSAVLKSWSEPIPVHWVDLDVLKAAMSA